MNMNQKGFASIILIVVTVVIIAVGGYFMFVKKSEPIVQQPTSTQSTTPIEIPESSTPAPKDETANWKKYRYDRYNFQISYPPDWTPEISTTFEEGSLGFDSPKDAQGNFMSFGVQRYSLGINAFGYPSETLTAPNTTVDGVEAYEDEGYINNPDGPSVQIIWLKKDNFIYSLTFKVFKEYNLPSQTYYEQIKPAKFTPDEEKIRDGFISTFQFSK